LLREQEIAMSTTLDRLKELSDLLRRLTLMDEDGLHTVLDEGFADSPPVWVERLPQKYWMMSLADDIKNSATLLEERVTPPGTVKTVQASIKIGPITIRPVTPEEKEELGRVREEGGSEQSE
jgi:hypothetical protein